MHAFNVYTPNTERGRKEREREREREKRRDREKDLNQKFCMKQLLSKLIFLKNIIM